MFNTIKPILAMATLFLCIAILGACGGSSGGGSNSASGTPMTMTVTPPTPPAPLTYRVEYASVVFLPDTASDFVTLTVHDDYRILRRSDGVSVGGFAALTIVVPGGANRLATTPNQLENVQFMLDSTWRNTPGVTVGQLVSELVYIADFPNHQCDSIRVQGFPGNDSRARGGFGYCLNASRVTIASVTVLKTHAQIYSVCWRDNRRNVTCDLREDGTGNFIGLAFPDQSYRRDDDECESAPFYAVGNCQNENAVEVGNFAAFVSGLDGNGYRQFGVRHRFVGEGWNAAAMVSHAKGAEFLDTWWGRLRFEHSIFDDAAAFAEYESGITSLRQRGFMFADIPISGGRVGFRSGDFTASFGRPMHYKGKGKNAAALHWQATKQTEFSFRNHNDNAEVHWQWRREL